MRKWLVPMLVVVLLFSLAAPAMAKPVKFHGQRVFVQHPFTAKGRYAVSADTTASIKTTGWVRPKLRLATDEATLTVRVQKRDGNKWVPQMSNESTSTLFNKRWDRKRTFYKSTVEVPAGRYRIRARFVWQDAKGREHIAWSKFTYFRVVAKKK